jgi:hypothetical protein
MLLAIACVPTLGLRFAMPRIFIGVTRLLFVVAGIVSLADYGLTEGGLAFGLVISIHAVGVAAYLNQYFPWPQVRWQLVRQLGVVLLSAFVFTAVGHRVMDRFVLAVESDDGPLLINPRAGMASVQPGERVAYRMDANHSNYLHIEAGIYLGAVIAREGETVQFTADGYSVSGRAGPALAMMPKKGQLKVGPNQVMIWPMGAQFRRVGTFAGETALFPHSALVGRPYKRWFWRTQNP